MLCQFTVKNFKSIRDEMTFDMQAAAISEHEDKVIMDKNGEQFLPVSAIYGPNGGGKSNVLEALHTVAAKVLRPLYATGDNEERVFLQKKLLIEPFAFSEEMKSEPTEFEVFFRTELAEYRYILHVKREIVVYECLDRVKLETGRRSALFERNAEETILKGVFAKLKISDELSETLSLLSYLLFIILYFSFLQTIYEVFSHILNFNFFLFFTVKNKLLMIYISQHLSQFSISLSNKP